MSSMAMPSGRPFKLLPPAHHRREPGKTPAMLLAVIVHIAFFSVIIFGVSWQVNRPAPAVAEIWDQLPPINDKLPVDEPKPLPPPLEKSPPPEALTNKVDIQLKAKQDLADKKQKNEVEKKQVELKQKRDAEAEKKRVEDENKRAEAAAKRAADDKAKADEAAKSAREIAVRDYAQRIADLIRNRANIPDLVNGKPVVQVKIRLLISGIVFDAQVIKPSGNRVYDEAVERAINGIRQWPLPANGDLIGSKRELILNIEHEK